MKAYTHKSITKDGILAKHYIGLNEENEIIVVRRMLIDVKDLKEWSISGWTVLRTYKTKILIENHIAFLPDTALFITHSINQLLE